MTFDIAAALVTFAFVTSITPGPNNLMLMASGTNFGFRRTVPHMLGVALGFVAMTVLVGLGLSQVFEVWPMARTVLGGLCGAFMLWLAWRLANAAPPETAAEGGRPLTFLEAAAFQWVNPKAWAMALTAVSLYAPDRSVLSVLLVAAIFGAVNLPSVSVWTTLGVHLRRFLTTPRRLTAFNWTMAGLLVLSLWPLLAG